MQTGITDELVLHIDHVGIVDSLEGLQIDQEYNQIMETNVREHMLKIIGPNISNEVLIGVYEKLLTQSSLDF